MKPWKRPVSVLVVIHTADLRVLLLERAYHPGYWQSVTGSQEEGESLRATALREVEEETGLHIGDEQLNDWRQQHEFEIFTEWRDRYAPGVTHNTEHVFSVELKHIRSVILAPTEHRDYLWLPWHEAAEKCFSWSNRDAIRALPRKPAPD